MNIKYGKAGDESNLVYIKCPYSMYLSWDKSVRINRIRCHKLIANNLENSLNEIYSIYGQYKITELNIDSFGGCYNFRNKQGGTSYSTHAYGCAIDIDPEHNLLHWNNKRAAFARPEYKPMISAFERNGFISLGIMKNYDWMHFQINDIEKITT